MSPSPRAAGLNVEPYMPFEQYSSLEACIWAVVNTDAQVEPKASSGRRCLVSSDTVIICSRQARLRSNLSRSYGERTGAPTTAPTAFLRNLSHGTWNGEACEGPVVHTIPADGRAPTCGRALQARLRLVFYIYCDGREITTELLARDKRVILVKSKMRRRYTPSGSGR